MTTVSDTAITHRRVDLDYLRVIAFGLLIFFHAAVAFTPDPLPQMMNPESSIGMQRFVGFLSQFRLALLFLISGVGVCFAMRNRDRKAFLAERCMRLLIPLMFGILVLVPPMVYLEKRFLGLIPSGFWGFYQSLFSQGVYPQGNLSWHHFWFVAYLFLYCLLGWPIFRRLRTPPGQRMLQRFSSRLARSLALYWPIVPLLIIELPLRILFPGFRDLIHDGASFSQWFFVFVAGYWFASSERLLNRTQEIRSLSLWLAIITSTILLTTFWSPQTGVSPLQDGVVNALEYFLFCAVRVANLWLWLLVCLGYAGRYLTHRNATVEYLNGAVYPLFCVHLPIMVALEYRVLPADWGIATKYCVITTGTIVLSLLTYEYLIRKIAPLRLLFGLKSVV